jgi:hypothetical protein
MEMPEPDSYLEEIGELLSRRFGYPLVLSHRDVAELRYWHGRGVSVAAVERGVAAALASRSRDSRPPLVYCRRAVLRAARELRSGTVCATGDAPTEKAPSASETTARSDPWPQRPLWRRLSRSERHRLLKRVRAKLAARRPLMSRRAYLRSYLALLNKYLEKTGT